MQVCKASQDVGTERRVADKQDTLFFAVLLQLERRQERVQLDLVHCGYDFDVREQNLEVFDGEVRDTDRFNFACVRGLSEPPD